MTIWKQVLFRLQYNVVMKYVHGKKRRMVRNSRAFTLELYNRAAIKGQMASAKEASSSISNGEECDCKWRGKAME